MTKPRRKGQIGDYEVGYGRPPKSGQIKPKEVRNPFGKNGRPKLMEDALVKVSSEVFDVTLDGKVSSMTQHEAAVRGLLRDVHKGDRSARKIYFEQMARRCPPNPPTPTPEDLAQQEAEQRERAALVAKLTGLLDQQAADKKAKAPRTRFGRDLRPIADDGA